MAPGASVKDDLDHSSVYKTGQISCRILLIKIPARTTVR
jgi:hypothetical protein